MAKANRRVDSELTTLRSIGPAMVRDLGILGISTVAQLRRADADMLYAELCCRTGVRHDPCVLDTFAAAVAQAKDPDLPAEQRNWWYWSRVRKAGGAAKAADAKDARGKNPG